MEDNDKKSGYTFLYSVHTGISICDKKNDCPLSILTFNFENHSIFVRDYKFIRSGKILDYGLEFIIKIESDNIEKTTALLKNEVEMLLNLFCFATRLYAGESTLDSIIKNNSSEISDVSFYVYPNSDRHFNQIGIIDLTFFSEIWENFNKCDNDEKRRILRAITWLRKGLNDEKFDEFISNWIGLEILSKIIRKQYVGIVNKNDEWGGLKKVFSDFLKVDESQFENIKNDYRNGIVHGFKELDDDFVREVENFIPILRDGLIVCICKSLKLSDAKIEKVLKLDIKKWRDLPFEIVKGKIENLPDYEKQKKQFPRCFPFIKEIIFEIIDGNKLTYQTDRELNFRLPKGTKFSKGSLETWGDKKSGIEMVENEIK